jgi:TM2 domain-containing membrane protein YozV
MKCTVHPDADAVGYCRNCGKALCAVCVRPVRDVLYCEDCLANTMGLPGASGVASPAAGPVPPSSSTAAAANYGQGVGPSPLLAFFLGFLPGLGAFYNEQFGKGIIHLALFLFLFILGVDGAVSGGAEAALWICISALWVYMPVDAYRTAKARLAGQRLDDPLENFSKGKPVGPFLIIGIGILLLLHNFDWFPWWRIQQFWPLLLIVVGGLMLRNRIGGR